MLMGRKFVLSMKMVSKLFRIDAFRASQYHDVLIVICVQQVRKYMYFGGSGCKLIFQ